MYGVDSNNTLSISRPYIHDLCPILLYDSKRVVREPVNQYLEGFTPQPCSPTLWDRYPEGAKIPYNWIPRK